MTVVDVIPSPKRFGAAKAFVTYLAFTVSQILVGIAIVVVVFIIAVVSGADMTDRTMIATIATRAVIPSLIASPIAAALATLLFARIWAWDLAHDSSPAGLGIVPAPNRSVAMGAAVGLTTALVYLAVAIYVFPPRPGTPLGPVAAAAASSVVARAIFIFIAVCIAPVLEEFVFRGLIYKGFATSWGSVAGAVLVSLLFILSHIVETFHYLPALGGISLLAAGTMVIRIRTRSLLPAIALHAAYNLAIVAAILL